MVGARDADLAQRRRLPRYLQLRRRDRRVVIVVRRQRAHGRVRSFEMGKVEVVEV